MSILQQIYNCFVDFLFINLLIICVNLNCQQFGIWFNLYSINFLSAFFSILLQIAFILSVFNQFNKLIVDLSINNLLIIRLNFYSCTGSRSQDLLEQIFAHISQCYYTKRQLFFHTQPIWITIFGIDEEYIILNNRKHIFPSVFSRPSTLLLPHLPHNKYNLLHSISNFICYNFLDISIFSTISLAPLLLCNYPTNAQHLQPTSDPPHQRSRSSNAPQSMVGHTLLTQGDSAPRPLHRRHGSPHGLISLFLGPLLLWPHLQPLPPS